MLARFGVNDEASQAEVDHVDGVGVVAQAHHDVVRLDVPMNVVHLVHVLHALQQLVEDHQRRFQTEFAAA